MARAKSSDPADVDWQAELARNERWLRGVVYARVGEPQAVDDVMQEIALAAVRQRAPLAEVSKVAAWLYRIAVTQSLLYRRSMGRRRKLHERYRSQVESRGTDRTADPLSWMLSDERRESVRSALKSLSSKDAEILLLKYSEDMSYKRMAELLGVSTSAVESRLHRARGRLRERLVQMEVVEPRS